MAEGDDALDPAQLKESLAHVHPVDLAELLDDMDLDERVRIFETLDPERAAQVLATMPREFKIEIVDRMGEQRLANVIDRMPDSAVGEIIDHLPAHKERSIMAKLGKEHAADIEHLRKYDEKTAGGRMTRNFVAVPDTFTSGEVIQAVQGAVDNHTVDFIYVVDSAGRLQGVCSLPKLMIHTPETPVSRFMRRDVTFVGPSVDQEEVAKIAQKYRLRHVPVVDNEMKLLGVVTLQDIIDVIRSEANEDVMKMAGASHMHPLHAPFLLRLKARLPWLATAMVLELAIAWVMKAYGGAIEMHPLAYFIPVIMAMGGSVGLQSATMVVRGFATGELTVGKGLRVVGAEMRVGLAIGVLGGITTGGMALLMQLGTDQVLQVGLIVLFSMTLTITIAATLGAMTPIVLQRLRLDPAVASGPLITAVNDLVNVAIYLGIAFLLMPKPHAG